MLLLDAWLWQQALRAALASRRQGADICAHYDHESRIRKAFAAFFAAAPASGEPSDALLERHAAALCKAYCRDFPQFSALFGESGELLSSEPCTSRKRRRGVE